MRSGIEAGRLCYRYLGADAVQHAEDDEPREQKGTTHLREHEGDPCNSYPLVPASSSNSAGCKFKRNATRSWPDMTDRQSLNLLQDVDDRLRNAGPICPNWWGVGNGAHLWTLRRSESGSPPRSILQARVGGLERAFEAE